MKNKHIIIASLGILLAASAPLVAAPPAAPSKTPAGATDPQEFPIVLKGTSVSISKTIRRDELSAKLKKIIGKDTGTDDESQLQYDFQPAKDATPVSLLFDWGKSGAISAITLDSTMENQPVKDLKAWLTKNAGPGKAAKAKKDIKTTTWECHGWRFTFRQGGDGEDSVYGFQITPLKSK